MRSASVIPWGDLVTAHWQTGIPDISVYTARRTSKVADLVIPIVQQVMKIGAVRDFAKKARFFMEYGAEGGCFTPSQRMGSGLVEQLPGATKLELSS